MPELHLPINGRLVVEPPKAGRAEVWALVPLADGVSYSSLIRLLEAGTLLLSEGSEELDAEALRRWATMAPATEATAARHRVARRALARSKDRSRSHLRIVREG